MTNINDLNQKLDDLFTDMELDPSPQKGVAKPVSWTWECNNQGYYTNVSPEVKEILGIDPGEFYSQPLSTFKLTTQSSRRLDVILGTLVEESQLTLQFHNHAGYSISIRMHIFLSKEEDGREPVLHGRNQIVPKH